MRLLIKMSAALLIGLGLTLAILQHEESFKQAFHGRLKNLFEATFNCEVSYELASINFFSGRLVAHHVFVKALDKKWSWHADTFTLSLAPSLLFIAGKCGLDVVIENMQAESLMDNGIPAIYEHIVSFIYGATDIPFTLKRLMIRRGSLAITDAAHFLKGEFNFSSEIVMQLHRILSSFYLTHAHVSLWDIPCLQGAHVRMSLEKVGNKALSITAQGKLTLDKDLQDEADCYLSANYDGRQGWVYCNNKDNSLQQQIRIHPDSWCSIEGIFPVALFNKFFFVSFHDLSGVGKNSLKFFYHDDYKMQGMLVLDNAYYKGIPLGTIRSFLNKDNALWDGTLLFDHDAWGALQGAWHWHEEKHEGEIFLKNSKTLQSPLTYFTINPGNVDIRCSYTKDTILGRYALVAHHRILQTMLQTGGTFALADDAIVAKGIFDKDSYSLVGRFNPSLMLTHFMYQDSDKNTLFSVASNPHACNELQAFLDYRCIQRILKEIYNIEMRGQGHLAVHGTLKDDLLVTGSLSLHDGHIQVPYTYNFIQNLEGSFNLDIKQKSLWLHDLLLKLHKGAIAAPRATFCWDEYKESFFMHMPLFFEKLFLNMQKDIFTECSGAVRVHKEEQEKIILKGGISLDGGECKKNIFSSALQKNSIPALYGSGKLGIECDLYIKSKKPLRIQTSFLNTDIALDIAIKEKLYNPSFTGTITLQGGSLLFPYRPLHITRGLIYFLPHQLDDPVIELIAKGKVKKYHVTLRTSGSLRKPHISLESTPPLTEEQILTLLLAGSEEGSVALVMPTVIMQNMEQLLFGPEQSYSKLETYFKNLLGPLKHVRFVPTFFDQTARGGFRGTILVDVSERLHGLIQKNFSLPEDTKIEIEYLLSDDVTLRALKDQRGDVGGEVEMRWKF
ncbi:MAG: translocation/assembly module TamB domain-containing protein [Candidatus Babeliales bacterium]